MQTFINFIVVTLSLGVLVFEAWMLFYNPSQKLLDALLKAKAESDKSGAELKSAAGTDREEEADKADTSAKINAGVKGIGGCGAIIVLQLVNLTASALELLIMLYALVSKAGNTYVTLGFIVLFGLSFLFGVVEAKNQTKAKAKIEAMGKEWIPTPMNPIVRALGFTYMLYFIYLIAIVVIG